MTDNGNTLRRLNAEMVCELTDKEAAKPYFQKSVARARWQGFFIAASIYLVTNAFFLFGRWTAP